MARHRNRRVPKLKFQKLRGIGWHVSYRDAKTGVPRRHRFGIEGHEREAEARVLYHAWVLNYLGGDNSKSLPTKLSPRPKSKPTADVLSGSLLEVGSALIESERRRARTDDDPRRRGTITAAGFRDRKR